MEDISLIFDVDDTLVQTSKTALKKDRLAAERLGLNQITEDDFYTCYGYLPFEQCVKIWHPEADIASYKKCYEQVKQVHPYRAIGNPGKTISGLMDNGNRVGILSNGNREKTDQKLTAAGIVNGIRDRLFFILCGDNLEFPKPDPRAFEKPVEMLRSPRNRIYYVGDCVDDFRAAKGAQINFIGVLSGFTSKKSFIEAGLDEVLIIPDIAGVQERLKSMK